MWADRICAKKGIKLCVADSFIHLLCALIMCCTFKNVFMINISPAAFHPLFAQNLQVTRLTHCKSAYQQYRKETIGHFRWMVKSQNL